MQRCSIIKDIDEMVWLVNCRITSQAISYSMGFFQKEISNELIVLRTEDGSQEFLVKLAPLHVNMKTKMITTNKSVEIMQ